MATPVGARTRVLASHLLCPAHDKRYALQGRSGLSANIATVEMHARGLWFDYMQDCVTGEINNVYIRGDCTKLRAPTE